MNDQRTGSKWTTQEDIALTNLVSKYGCNDWDTISHFLPNRTSQMCKNHYKQQVKLIGSKGPWTDQEDAIITEAVQNGQTKWSQIARLLNNRVGKQCRERWYNHLDPSLKKTPWTEDEDTKLIQLQAMLGNTWTKISYELPGRSENEVKNRWYSAPIRRRLKYSSEFNDNAMSILLTSTSSIFSTEDDSGSPASNNSSIDDNIIKNELSKVTETQSLFANTFEMMNQDSTNSSLIQSSSNLTHLTLNSDEVISLQVAYEYMKRLFQFEKSNANVNNETRIDATEPTISPKLSESAAIESDPASKFGELYVDTRRPTRNDIPVVMNRHVDQVPSYKRLRNESTTFNDATSPIATTAETPQHHSADMSIQGNHPMMWDRLFGKQEQQLASTVTAVDSNDVTHANIVNNDGISLNTYSTIPTWESMSHQSLESLLITTLYDMKTNSSSSVGSSSKLSVTSSLSSDRNEYSYQRSSQAETRTDQLTLVGENREIHDKTSFEMTATSDINLTGNNNASTQLYILHDLSPSKSPRDSLNNPNGLQDSVTVNNSNQNAYYQSNYFKSNELLSLIDNRMISETPQSELNTDDLEVFDRINGWSETEDSDRVTKTECLREVDDWIKVVTVTFEEYIYSCE